MESNRPWSPIDRATSLSDLRYLCTKIDLFDLETPPELAIYAEYAWVSLGNGGYRLGLTEGNAIAVVPTILDKWEVQLRQRGREKTTTSKTDLRSAILAAESLVENQFADLLPLVKLRTSWRRAPATDKQIRVLRHSKIEVPAGLTKGQASHLIGMLN